MKSTLTLRSTLITIVVGIIVGTALLVLAGRIVGHTSGDWKAGLVPCETPTGSTMTVACYVDGDEKYIVTEDGETFPADAKPAYTLPPCAVEDSEDCYWDAQARSNGQGTSFVRLGGVTYYPEGY